MKDIEESPMIACAVCSTDTNIDDTLTTYDAQIICSDCHQSCARCGDIGTTDEHFPHVDGDPWCESCVENRASWCESCEEYNSEGTNFIEDRNAYWCYPCTDDNGSFCNYCENYNVDGCDSCDEEPATIHDYNYRPDMIFHTTKDNERLFFGMELELECRNGRSEPADYAQRLEVFDLAYLKSDGSLNNGFEIVTHPMTHDFFKNEADELWNTIRALKMEHNVMTWGAPTTGVHIHISRTGFNGGAHMHRFLNLVYTNEKLFSDVAGRKSERWAKFNDVDDVVRNGEDEEGYASYKQFRSFTKKINNNRSSDRYSAVNTQNLDTLEMRIFRSTTRPERLKAYLDLAHASVEYTRIMPIQEVKDGALSADRFMQYIQDNGSLYSDLVTLIERLEITTVGISRQNVSN
jgi:hypothetical protein